MEEVKPLCGRRPITVATALSLVKRPRHLPGRWCLGRVVGSLLRPHDQGFNGCQLAVQLSLGFPGPVMSGPGQGTAIRYAVCHAKRAGMNSPSPSKLIVQSPCHRKARCLGFNHHVPRRYLSYCTSEDGALNKCRHVTRARWSTPRWPPAMPSASLEAT